MKNNYVTWEGWPGDGPDQVKIQYRGNVEELHAIATKLLIEWKYRGVEYDPTEDRTLEGTLPVLEKRWKYARLPWWRVRLVWLKKEIDLEISCQKDLWSDIWEGICTWAPRVAIVFLVWFFFMVPILYYVIFVDQSSPYRIQKVR